MLESFNGKEGYTYQKLTEEEQQARGILGRLVGPIADTQNPTRNGRKYNSALWESVFEDPIVKEKIDNRALFGELGHPADREEVDMEKIAVCLAEQPKKGKDGLLYGVFDILSTPAGHILKTLCDYGTTVGISSRGTGDIIQDENGEDMVDPSTYSCECFDVVIVPAMEKARLQYVTEGLAKKKTLKQSLQESLEKANDKDKRIMEETLKELNIDLENSEETREDKKEVVKDVKEDESEKVNDVESSKLVKSLQDALKSRAELEMQLQKLQEEKAVSDTKVNKLEEELNRFKQTSIRLSNVSISNKSLNEENQSLKEQLKEKAELVESINETMKKQEETINEQKEIINRKNARIKQIMENLNKISTESKDKETLKESLNTQKNSYEKQIKTLNERLETIKSDSQTQIKEYSSKLEKNSKLVEKYKNYLNESINKYIEAKAELFGVKPQEIKNRLNESYTFEDIDNICKDLQKYNLRMSKLPFSLNKDTKVRVTESKQSRYEKESPEDDISSLIELSGIKL